ncbi:hypothetical protein KAI04_00745 [Candidatus Pacearchaeota archaeon]|nr:hypothetical protein [Candidatus Pacearchaeota archaeon]
MVKKKKVSKKKSSSKSTKGLNNQKKLEMVFRRLVFFLIFFILFLVLGFVTSNELWSNFFGIAKLIFGFISVALLIVLLILWFLKIMKK